MIAAVGVELVKAGVAPSRMDIGAHSGLAVEEVSV
jgi:hypothetical protein